jgi:predicted DNA-binding WGR domain protein
MKLIRKITLENTQDGHFKRWIGELYDDDTVITRWGRAELDDDTFQSKMFPKAGENFLNKKEREKLGKGYEPV